MTFQELLYDTRRWVFNDGTSTVYSTTDITASLNRALEETVQLIREAQGRWQWDDSNNTDFSIATTGLVTNQQDYALDPTHYRMERVEVLDTAGNWNKLQPMDQADIYDRSLTDYLKTAGQPLYYDKIGDSIFLYPKPSYTQSASLKVFYERGPSYFATSDDTKEPGFNKLFHRILSMKAAEDYSTMNSLAVAGGVMRGGFKTGLLAKISEMEDAIQEFYSQRGKDEHITLRARKFNFR